MWNFNPRAPCGARRHVWQYADGKHIISIHAPRAGRDCSPWASRSLTRYFNPRAPCGARRCSSVSSSASAPFQSTRPVRGATVTEEEFLEAVKFQSTRPVRGATPIVNSSTFQGGDFNPRAPCGARLIITTRGAQPRRFQSTRPVRGATNEPAAVKPAARFQSTRPVRGATNMTRTESLSLTFQSTRPVRGATSVQAYVLQACEISIHAPRAGRDS